MPTQIVDGLLSWASILEDATREQAERTASLPWIRPHVALMPDAHWGMGSTVGSVVPTEDVVMPACVGVDLGCGMSVTRTQLTATDFECRDLAPLRQAIEREIPVSMGHDRHGSLGDRPCVIGDRGGQINRHPPRLYAERAACAARQRDRQRTGQRGPGARSASSRELTCDTAPLLLPVPNHPPRP